MGADQPVFDLNISSLIDEHETKRCSIILARTFVFFVVAVFSIRDAMDQPDLSDTGSLQSLSSFQVTPLICSTQCTGITDPN